MKEFRYVFGKDELGFAPPRCGCWFFPWPWFWVLTHDPQVPELCFNGLIRDGCFYSFFPSFLPKCSLFITPFLEGDLFPVCFDPPLQFYPLFLTSRVLTIHYLEVLLISFQFFLVIVPQIFSYPFLWVWPIPVHHIIFAFLNFTPAIFNWVRCWFPFFPPFHCSPVQWFSPSYFSPSALLRCPWFFMWTKPFILRFFPFGAMVDTPTNLWLNLVIFLALSPFHPPALFLWLFDPIFSLLCLSTILSLPYRLPTPQFAWVMSPCLFFPFSSPLLFLPFPPIPQTYSVHLVFQRWMSTPFKTVHGQCISGKILPNGEVKDLSIFLQFVPCLFIFPLLPGSTFAPSPSPEALRSPFSLCREHLPLALTTPFLQTKFFFLKNSGIHLHSRYPFGPVCSQPGKISNL